MPKVLRLKKSMLKAKQLKRSMPKVLRLKKSMLKAKQLKRSMPKVLRLKKSMPKAKQPKRKRQSLNCMNSRLTPPVCRILRSLIARSVLLDRWKAMSLKTMMLRFFLVRHFSGMFRSDQTTRCPVPRAITLVVLISVRRIR